MVENFSYLTILQLFTSLVPVITYPYLVRVLGIDLYGTVIFAQTIISYFSLIVDFGFKSSAAKEVAVHQDNKEKLSEIVSAVFCLRSILFLFSFLCLCVAVCVIPAFREYKLLYLFSFGFTLNELLLPQFYFLGVEKMKYVTIMNIVVKTVFVVLTFVLITEPSDYLYVPLLNTFGFMGGGFVALYILFVKEKIRLVTPSFKNLKYYLKETVSLFATDVIMSIKDRINVILIGVVLGMGEVAIYDLGMKIVSVLNKPIDILNTVVFPKIAKEHNVAILKKVILYSFVVMGMLIVLLQFPLSDIIGFFSDYTITDIFPIRFMLLIPLIMTISLPIARNFLIAFGHYKTVFFNMLYVTLLYCFLVTIGLWTHWLSSIGTFITLTLVVYFYEMIYRILITRKILHDEDKRMY